MTLFQSAPDGVNPDAVPKRTLYTGAEVPVIGLGTFGSDRYSHAEVAAAVHDAILSGYRHIDCASVYENEREVGQTLQTLIQSGLPREDLWITSKVWNDKHGEGDVRASCEKSLSDLGLDYLDLFLVHWPFPNYHGKGVDVTSRDPHAQSYIHEEFMKTWRQMEELVDAGLVHHIGTSNMTVPKLKLVLRDARIQPAASEMELHPHFQQPELFQFTVDNGILPIGYSPLGSPSRPERDKTADDSVDMEDPVILAIAERLGVTPAAVCLQWAIGRGQIPIPFSVKRSQYLSSLQAAAAPPLSEADMTAIAGIDKNCRLIKGQVFLWKEGQSWEDLWDLSGEITPP